MLRAPQTFSTSWCGLDTLAADNAFLLLFVEEDAVRCESSHIAASVRDGPVLSLGVESCEEDLASVCAVFTAGTVSAPSSRLAPQHWDLRAGPAVAGGCFETLSLDLADEQVLGRVCAVFTAGTVSAPSSRLAPKGSELPLEGQDEEDGGVLRDLQDLWEEVHDAPGGTWYTHCFLSAVTCSLVMGFFVWLVLKAKGLIVAGLVAEVLKALEEREAQANQHEPAASEPQVECGGTPQTEEVRGLVQDFSTVERGDRGALASPEPRGPDELVSVASSMA